MLINIYIETKIYAFLKN